MTTIEQAFELELRAPGTIAAPRVDRRERFGRPAPGLRRALVLLDAVAAALAWAIGLGLPGGLPASGDDAVAVSAGAACVLTIATLLALGSQHLYLSRVCSIRSVEIVGLARATVFVGLFALVLPRVLAIDVGLSSALVGGGLAFVLLNLVRSAYRSWLQRARRVGRYVRRVVVVGTNEEGYDLVRLLSHHPELGYRVVSVVGDSSDYERLGFDVPRAGDVDGVLAALDDLDVNGVLIAASAVPSDTLNRVSRELLARQAHVHLSSGLRGIDHRRIRHQPLAHEPLFYLEPIMLARWQLAVKRVIDLVLAVVGGIFVAAPIVAGAAIIIKLYDRGPVFFRQQRVGQHGRTFTCIKLRTMAVDAERRYVDLAATMAGRDGPLIKLNGDPRVTPFGRFLRATSIDELPQLINVVRGEMSLIGPRPAQASEVAQFDDDLLLRHRVRPGMSGLWQVEARDNPSFAAYRRYDLFYIENWSITLDVAILFATVQRLLFRALSPNLRQ